MGITVLASGTPEVADSVWRLTMEVVYAMGRYMDLERVLLAKPDTFVLSLCAIPPDHGIPNKTSFKRSAQEFWSSHNIDFEQYFYGDAKAKLGAISAALVGAINQHPKSRMVDSQKKDFCAAVAAAVELLRNEPDRLVPFERPLSEGR